jgi:hypothetical protein
MDGLSLNPIRTGKRATAAVNAAGGAGASDQQKNTALSAYRAQYWWAFGVGLVCLVVAVVVSYWVSFGPKAGTFTPDASKFSLFAGFYVAAQALERFMEHFSGVCPPLGDDAATKADRAWVVGGITLVIAVFTTKLSGLLFLNAIGWTSPSKGTDVLVSSLVLAGGSKSLHDLITNIQAKGSS